MGGVWRIWLAILAGSVDLIRQNYPLEIPAEPHKQTYSLQAGIQTWIITTYNQHSLSSRNCIFQMNCPKTQDGLTFPLNKYSKKCILWGRCVGEGGWCSGPLPWPYRDMYDPLLLLLGQPTIKIWTNDQENISSRKDSFTKQISYFINHICPVRSPLFHLRQRKWKMSSILTPRSDRKEDVLQTPETLGFTLSVNDVLQHKISLAKPVLLPNIGEILYSRFEPKWVQC